MNTFLQEFAKKFVERWAAVLLGPGLLFVCCAVVAHRLGAADALSLPALRAEAVRIRREQSAADAGALVVTLLTLFGAALAAGAVASAMGRMFARAWMPERPAWYVRMLVRRRQLRWDRAERRLTAARVRAGRSIALARMRGAEDPGGHPRVERARRRLERQSPVRPDTPTWCAQRMAEATGEVGGRYDLDLALLWPYIWATAEPDHRADITTAQNAYAAATRLSGWAVLYAALLPATGWWPGLLVAVFLAVLGRHRARRSIDLLARQVLCVVDLTLRPLAERLGVSAEGPFSSQHSAALAKMIRPRA